eukprot:CAMPEP_0181524734 /NCGR_PEP_ID=MMETSP1110-20121109/68596_1 /TAXON_ID=174948 /ORGANISM="Symbiodinium sp., Strain CCMP421" /LENGTH=88 /DNA_ID=CAMNT_0023655499 /DNA_START=37 /DNA_END=299 /DNA_ORIENTATION=+
MGASELLEASRLDLRVERLAFSVLPLNLDLATHLVSGGLCAHAARTGSKPIYPRSSEARTLPSSSPFPGFGVFQAGAPDPKQSEGGGT